MRQFLVLGYETKNRDCEGEMLYLGPNRGTAMSVMREQGKHLRRSLHDLGVPQMQRVFATSEPESNDDPDDEVKLTDSAQKLADEHQLTGDDLAKIEPTGASGNIVKSDVEAYLEALTEPDDEPTEDEEADQVEPESIDDPDDEEDAEA